MKWPWGTEPHRAVTEGPEGRWDVEDDPSYWEMPEHGAAVCGASYEQVSDDPLAGIVREDQLPDTLLESWLADYDVPKDHTVLELGCGGGASSLRYWRASERRHIPGRMFMVDQVGGFLRVAQARFVGLGIVDRCFFHATRCEQVSRTVGDQQYDVVYARRVLQHNRGSVQHDIFRQIGMVLATGGLLILRDEQTFNRLGEENAYLTPMYCNPRASAGTAAWWISRVCGAGFVLLAHEGSSYLFRKAI